MLNSGVLITLQKIMRGISNFCYFEISNFGGLLSLIWRCLHSKFQKLTFQIISISSLLETPPELKINLSCTSSYTALNCTVVQWWTLHGSSVLYCTVQYSSVMHCTVLYSTDLWWRVWYSVYSCKTEWPFICALIEYTVQPVLIVFVTIVPLPSPEEEVLYLEMHWHDQQLLLFGYFLCFVLFLFSLLSVLTKGQPLDPERAAPLQTLSSIQGPP